MKVLVFGAWGQLGWELQRTCPPQVTPVFCDVPKVDFFSTDSIDAMHHRNLDGLHHHHANQSHNGR